MSYSFQKLLEGNRYLKEVKEGFWVNTEDEHEVSYPPRHHQLLQETQESSFWYLHREYCIKQVLKKYPSQALLDVGGSNGFLTVALNRILPTALLEPGISGVENAYAKGARPVIHARWEQVGFEANSIPAVGLFDVLEHIDDDLGFLKSLSHSIESSGRLYVTVPAYSWLWSAFDESVGHCRRYNRQMLESRLEQAGFELEYFSYLYWPLPLPIWLIRRFQTKNSLDRASRDKHHASRSLVGFALRILLALEPVFISKGWGIPFGSSCICVAKKP